MEKPFHVFAQGMNTDEQRELPVEKQRFSWTSSKDYETMFDAFDAFEYATYCDETVYARLECPNGDLYQFSNGRYKNKQLKEMEK